MVTILTLILLELICRVGSMEYQIKLKVVLKMDYGNILISIDVASIVLLIFSVYSSLA